MSVPTDRVRRITLAAGVGVAGTVRSLASQGSAESALKVWNGTAWVTIPASG